MAFFSDIKKRYTILAMPTFMKNLNAAFAVLMRDEKFQKLIIKEHQDYRLEDETDEEILDNAFGDRYSDWMLELENKGKFQGDKIVLYRGVSAKDIKQVNLNKLGVYWTWDKRKANNYSDKNTNLPLFIFTALATIEDIDIKETLKKIVWAGYTSEESEREITLKPKTRITLIDPIHKEVQAGLM